MVDDSRQPKPTQRAATVQPPNFPMKANTQIATT